MGESGGQLPETGHVWGAVGPNAADLWNCCVNCRADEGSIKGRQPCAHAPQPPAPPTADPPPQRAAGGDQ